MKITITGGGGFIGSNLVNVFKNKHEISIIDVKKSVVEGVNFFEGNITDKQLILDATRNSDIVIHLAAALGVVNTEKNPVFTLDTNIIGTKNILEACRINNVKKIIFSSSSEVYGEPLKTPISENDRVIPITNYGISKLAGEEYIKAYSKNYGLKFTIFRLFNVYGEQQGDAWVIPEFVSKAVKNQKIIIHGDGSQIRAFCHVSDVCKAFLSALDKGNFEIFNIGNNKEPLSIRKLAEKIILLSNSNSNIDYIPFEKSNRNRTEIMTRIPNIEKAKKILGYNPEISLDEGLKSIIKKMNNAKQ